MLKDCNDILVNDEKVIKSTLDNGLTYYICENKCPRGRVVLALAVKAGSVLEDESQKGVAHFIEHMCLCDNLNSRAGAGDESCDLFQLAYNGYTNYDETVCVLNGYSAPGSIEEYITILRDMVSGDIIRRNNLEKVRKNIIMEWESLNQDVDFKLRTNVLPLILNNSRYASRMPIGNIQSISHMDYEALMEYHAKWYRPELISVFVVGDIDAFAVKELIKREFAGFRKTGLERERTYYEIPCYPKKEYIINSLEGIAYPEIQLYHMNHRQGIKTVCELKRNLIGQVSQDMLQKYLEDEFSKADIPINEAICTKDRFIKMYEFSVLSLSFSYAVPDAPVVLLNALEKIKAQGFPAEYLHSQKQCLVSNMHSCYENLDEIDSDKLLKECLNDFLYDEPVLSADYEYRTSVQLINEISEDDVNRYIKSLLDNQNSVLVVNMPVHEKTGFNCRNFTGRWKHKAVDK